MYSIRQKVLVKSTASVPGRFDMVANVDGYMEFWIKHYAMRFLLNFIPCKNHS